MIPVKNEKTTLYELGDYLVSRWSRGQRRPQVYRIVGLTRCSAEGTRPCGHCKSGNIAYVVKRFNVKLGYRSFNICASHDISSYYREYYKWDVVNRRIIEDS